MVIDEIRSFLNDYFDVLQDQNLTKFDNVFDSGSVLYSPQNGAVVVRPFNDYRVMVQGRESPESKDSPRLDEILMIDILSSEMALVKVRLRLFDSIMADYLNLMKVDGQWRIYAKHFHRVGDAI